MPAVKKGKGNSREGRTHTEAIMASDPPSTSSSENTRTSWSTSSLVSKEPILRIGIIGAGLGGLALGQLLQNTPNVQVTVYERSEGSIDRLSGYRVMLDRFVLQNLQAALRPEVWQRVANSIGTHPQEGEELRFIKRQFILAGSFMSQAKSDSSSAMESRCSVSTLKKCEKL